MKHNSHPFFNASLFLAKPDSHKGGRDIRYWEHWERGGDWVSDFGSFWEIGIFRFAGFQIIGKLWKSDAGRVRAWSNLMSFWNSRLSLELQNLRGLANPTEEGGRLNQHWFWKSTCICFSHFLATGGRRQLSPIRLGITFCFINWTGLRDCQNHLGQLEHWNK